MRVLPLYRAWKTNAGLAVTEAGGAAGGIENRSFTESIRQIGSEGAALKNRHKKAQTT